MVDKQLKFASLFLHIVDENHCIVLQLATWGQTVQNIFALFSNAHLPATVLSSFPGAAWTACTAFVHAGQAIHASAMLTVQMHLGHRMHQVFLREPHSEICPCVCNHTNSLAEETHFLGPAQAL